MAGEETKALARYIPAALRRTPNWTMAGEGGGAAAAAADEYAVPASMGAAGAAAGGGRFAELMPWLKGVGKTAGRVAGPAFIAYLLYSLLNSGNKASRDLGLPFLHIGSAGEDADQQRANLAQGALADRDAGDLSTALLAERQRGSLIGTAEGLGEASNQQLALKSLGDTLDMRRVAIENRRSLRDAAAPVMPSPREIMAMMGSPSGMS